MPQMDWRGIALRDITSTTLDVLVMGGGINGAGILRDLALRAHSVSSSPRIALVDRGHFSSGTSGRNSQLIHGGLRYLKNFEFKLVSEALSERAILLRTAPHLVEPLAFIIPMRNRFNSIFYGAGLYLYDFLAGKNGIEHHRYLSAAELHRVEPGMQRFFSGARFFDCRVHSARLVLLNIREAVQHGANAVNYMSVESYNKRSDGLWDVELLDHLSGDRRRAVSRTLVNAAGSWSKEGSLRLVRGSHLILSRLGASENAISYFGHDGRIVFFIPWGRRHAFTLVGTTDVDHQGGPDQVRITPEEIRYLLNVVDEVFPGARPHQPICAYSSLRPLVRDESSSATKTSREHRIWADERGIVHVAGGKYTTYRLMSEEAVDLITSEHWPDLAARHVTADAPISGNSVKEVRALFDRAPALSQKFEIAEQDVRDLIKDYGIDTTAVLSLVHRSKSGPLTPLEKAQISFAASREYVERLSDLMFVSTYWGYERHWTASVLEPFACELGKHLGWDDKRMRAEVDRTLQAADQP